MSNDQTRKQKFDDLIDLVIAYSTKHDIAFIISIGQFIPETEKTMVMASYQRTDGCDLTALAVPLVTAEPIAEHLLAAMMMTAMEHSKTRKPYQKS